MAAQRGGRRRAPQQDTVRDALVAALSDALDVEAGRLTVSVTLDDAPVPADRLPLTLELAELGVAGPDDSDEPVEAPAPGAAERAPARRGRRPQSVESAEDEAGSGGEDAPVERSNREPAGRDQSGPVPVSAEDLDEEAEAAADLIEGLLDALDLPGDLRISIQEAHAEVEVMGLEEGVLIGRRGQTLDAVQELVRTAMQRRFERRSRVLVDVDGYRARRLEKLLERADEAIEEVLASGEPQRLEPMDAIERRLVHQRVAEAAGVISTSHGREPARRIVIELVED